MSSDPAAGPSGVAVVPEQVRERVQWPAMFLIANAVLNLLVALFQTGRFVTVAVAPAGASHEARVEMWKKLASHSHSPVAGAQLESMHQTDPDDLKRRTVAAEAVIAVVLLVPAVLALAGGVCMYRLRGYSLAVVGSLASAVPCLSPMTCCCLGEVVGVWCVAVLIQPQVRDAFH
jgi:hypothetical protein